MDSHVRPAAGLSAPLIQWLIAYGTFAIPQAAGPIAFTLLAMPLTGSSSSGAVLVLAITVAQVAGAVPLVRLGAGRNAVSYLRVLLSVRALALVGMAALAKAEASFLFLVVAAALGGLVNGAAFGLLRSILNHLAHPSGMPRALGMAATLNELTFVAAPIAASLLGTAIDPVVALVILVLLGTAPVVLVPAVPEATTPAPLRAGESLLRPAILLWLACTLATSAVTSAVEIGAVAIAINYGLAPAEGAIFAVALCIAAVAGGIWVSARNRAPGRRTVPLLLALLCLGAILTASNFSVIASLIGAVIIGCFLAPLGTYNSLRLDALAPGPRKAEVFALSRTANSLGIILTSANLTWLPVETTMAISAAALLLVTLGVAVVTYAEHPSDR
ncbi:MFS transporter [Roseococcus sp. YIM B11640]|uniref:MFS transporter n=1 Tax=Roseococcus sp. YIM B11640 TaxID=3133973 RepID=UPI003C79B77F